MIDEQSVATPSDWICPRAGTKILPISSIIPTRNRTTVLGRTLKSLWKQSALPSELIIVDASEDNASEKLVRSYSHAMKQSGCEVNWVGALTTGAAAQRNQGLTLATCPVIGFFDDDIVFETDCLMGLWQALQSDERLGGVNAMIVNQNYRPPGSISRLLFRILSGQSSSSYAGRVLGPGVNLLPEDSNALPDVVPVEWLNTTCTLYRREVLPDPPFPKTFTGYSLMEDLALSLVVGQKWNLANARTARVYHDTQPGAHKNDSVAISRMEFVNRHYIMTNVLQRRNIGDYAKLLLWEQFQLCACVQQRGGMEFWRTLKGKFLGLVDIICRRSTRRTG